MTLHSAPCDAAFRMACLSVALSSCHCTCLTMHNVVLLSPACAAQVVSSGMCGCLGYDLTQGDDYETIFNNMVLMDEVIGDADADTKRQVVAAMCSTTINDGDHLQVRRPHITTLALAGVKRPLVAVRVLSRRQR